MQSFAVIMYLYIMETMRYLLLLALIVGAQASLPAMIADGDARAPSGETYAVIVSGGRSKMFNHERYWNDCAFLYRTLRQDFNVPKDHITLLIADGDNPAADMLRDGAMGFASSPTDLDGDGQPDLTLAATRQNLDAAFRRLSTTLTVNDHLFIFITDHGEKSPSSPTPNPSPEGRGAVTMEASPSEGGLVGACLWLWGEEQLSPDELAAMVGQCHPATMNILLGQCYAGAFVAELDKLNSLQGRIITAACAANQLSWSCKERPYDEFVYHWTCAIAQHDEQGRPVNSDRDGNGLVSMQEAFDYACQHDRRPETPSITSVPDGFADGWSFSGIGIENGIRQVSSINPQNSNVYDLQGRKANKQ